MVDGDIAVNVFAKDQIVAAENTLNHSHMDFTANSLASFLVRECSDWKIYISSALR